MGMFDSVYVDASMAHLFPLKDGALPEYSREWQTKDLECLMNEIVIKDNQLFARFQGELRPWDITAAFDMYTSNYPPYENMGEYHVMVYKGVIGTVTAKNHEKEASLDSYPFAEERAKAFEEGMKNTITWLEELDKKTPILTKILRKIRKIKRAFYYAWEALKGAL